ncbi:MAG TPA: hypothetical protein DEP35_22460 [Deltaproteobacteria bacterium]|nr:hypothetical protein [Deltaproteobacteria bacterium]
MTFSAERDLGRSLHGRPRGKLRPGVAGVLCSQEASRRLALRHSLNQERAGRSGSAGRGSDHEPVGFSSPGGEDRHFFPRTRLIGTKSLSEACLPANALTRPSREAADGSNAD